MRQGGGSGHPFRLRYVTLLYFTLLLLAGTKGSRWELRHLIGPPGGGEDKGLSYSS